MYDDKSRDPDIVYLNKCSVYLNICSINVLGINDEAFSKKQIKSIEIADGVGLMSG